MGSKVGSHPNCTGCLASKGIKDHSHYGRNMITGNIKKKGNKNTLETCLLRELNDRFQWCQTVWSASHPSLYGTS